MGTKEKAPPRSENFLRTASQTPFPLLMVAFTLLLMLSLVRPERAPMYRP